jgi:DNA primase
LIKRLTNRFALALDPDLAGDEATRRGLNTARESLPRKTTFEPLNIGVLNKKEYLQAELLAIPLPPGKDPDEIIQEDPGRWKELVERAEPLIDFFFRILTQDLDLKTARGKSLAVDRIAPIIREMGDEIQRTHYTQYLARLVQTPEQTVAKKISELPSQKRPTPSPTIPQAEESPERAESKLEDYF